MEKLMEHITKANARGWYCSCGVGEVFDKDYTRDYPMAAHDHAYNQAEKHVARNTPDREVRCKDCGELIVSVDRLYELENPIACHDWIEEKEEKHECN